IAPGDNGLASPYGVLTTNGATTTLGSNTTFSVDLDKASAGAGVGYDQLVVDGGTFALNDATLTGTATANVPNGDPFTIIQAINGGTVTTNVNNFDLSEVYVGGQKFLVHYHPGVNGSVVLERVLASTSVVLTSSHTPSVFGEPVTFTATITPEDA